LNVAEIGIVMQFFIGGVRCPIPIHLMALAPLALRTLVVGLIYQPGNLISFAWSTIQSSIGERYPLPPKADGTKRFDYGKVIGFMGAVWAYILLWLLLGPEMSQGEREEQREEALAWEAERASGRSLREMGIARARGDGGISKGGPGEKGDSVGAVRFENSGEP
jgi:SHS family lactate transporter-like MFS transporter